MSYMIILGVVIGFAFIGLIIAAKKQSSNAIAKPLVLVFTLIILTCGVLLLISRLGPPNIKNLVNNNLIFSKSEGYKLGKYVTEQMPKGEIILLIDPSKKENKAQQAMIDGLNEGFNNTDAELTIVSLPLPKILPVKQIGAIDYNKFTSKEFNKAIKRYPKCDMIISLVGLPVDLQNLKILQKFIKEPSKAPKIALLNCRVPNMYQLMKGKFVTTIVYPNPKEKYNDDSPDSGDLMKTFDMHYLLITPKNMDQILKEFPGQVFRDPEKSKK